MKTFDLDSATGARLHIKLFKNVENVPELRKKITSGELDCCFVNPKLVLDAFQLVVAANKALALENRTTKTVFTEILFNLSISKNISRSLQQFGISDECEDLLVLTISKSGDSRSDISSEIKGCEADLGTLSEISDVNAVKKAYKIGSNEEKCTTLLDSVVSRIVTKDFISH